MKFDGMNPAPPVTRTRFALTSGKPSGAPRSGDVARTGTKSAHTHAPEGAGRAVPLPHPKRVGGGLVGRPGAPLSHRRRRVERLVEGNLAPNTSELAVDRVQRPPLHLALNPPQVLADERKDEALDPEYEQDEAAEEQRAREVGARDPVDEAPRRDRQRRSRAEHPNEDAGPLDRLRPEPGEHVQREPGQAQRAVPRSSLACSVRYVHLGHARAARQHERLRELLLPDRAEHGLDRATAIGVEGVAEVAG